MIHESTISQLEKRARGFRRIISSLNDLPMYGINPVIDKILFVKIEALKEHLKKKIQKNNEKLNEIYTTSISLLLHIQDMCIKNWRKSSIPQPVSAANG